MYLDVTVESPFETYLRDLFVPTVLHLTVYVIVVSS